MLMGNPQGQSIINVCGKIGYSGILLITVVDITAHSLDTTLISVHISIVTITLGAPTLQLQLFIITINI